MIPVILIEGLVLVRRAIQVYKVKQHYDRQVEDKQRNAVQANVISDLAHRYTEFEEVYFFILSHALFNEGFKLRPDLGIRTQDVFDLTLKALASQRFRSSSSNYNDRGSAFINQFAAAIAEADLPLEGVFSALVLDMKTRGPKSPGLLLASYLDEQSGPNELATRLGRLGYPTDLVTNLYSYIKKDEFQRLLKKTSESYFRTLVDLTGTWPAIVLRHIRFANPVTDITGNSYRPGHVSIDVPLMLTTSPVKRSARYAKPSSQPVLITKSHVSDVERKLYTPNLTDPVEEKKKVDMQGNVIDNIKRAAENLSKLKQTWDSNAPNNI